MSQYYYENSFDLLDHPHPRYLQESQGSPGVLGSILQKCCSKLFLVLLLPWVLGSAYEVPQSRQVCGIYRLICQNWRIYGRLCVCVCVCVCILSHVQLWTIAARLLCPSHFPGKNNGVGSHSLLQGIFLTQGLKPSLLSPALAGRFSTTVIPGNPLMILGLHKYTTLSYNFKPCWVSFNHILKFSLSVLIFIHCALIS